MPNWTPPSTYSAPHATPSWTPTAANPHPNTRPPRRAESNQPHATCHPRSRKNADRTCRPASPTPPRAGSPTTSHPVAQDRRTRIPAPNAGHTTAPPHDLMLTSDQETSGTGNHHPQDAATTNTPSPLLNPSSPHPTSPRAAGTTPDPPRTGPPHPGPHAPGDALPARKGRTDSTHPPAPNQGTT